MPKFDLISAELKIIIFDKETEESFTIELPINPTTIKEGVKVEIK